MCKLGLHHIAILRVTIEDAGEVSQTGLRPTCNAVQGARYKLSSTSLMNSFCLSCKNAQEAEADDWILGVRGATRMTERMAVKITCV